MAEAAKTISLPEELREFAEERVRAGEAESVDDVVREALEERQLAALRAELDQGAAELDAGDAIAGPAEDVIAALRAGLAFDEAKQRVR